MQNTTQHCGRVHPQDFAEALLRWAREGFAELGDTGGLGIGSTVSAVLRSQGFTENPTKAAKKVWEKSGRHVASNGSVMRTAVLGVPEFWDQEVVLQNTAVACTVTHYDPRCRAACVAITSAVAQLLRGRADVAAVISRAASDALDSIGSEATAEVAREFHSFVSLERFSDAALDDGPTIGFALKTMASGLIALRMDDFEKSITELSLQAGDADTNAAVAGALLGCKIGFSHLPKRWLEGLIHGQWLVEVSRRFWASAMSLIM